MSEASQVQGILLTHGGMAEGLVDAVERITGPLPGVLTPLSNEGCSPDALRQQLDEAAGDQPAVIFTDLQSGSCAVAARIACGGAGPRGVVFGVNLPMLLDFVFHRDLPLEELVPRLVDRGREGVQGLTPQAICADPPVSG